MLAMFGARLLHPPPQFGNVMVHVGLYGQGDEHHQRVGPHSHDLRLHSHE